MQSDPTVLSPAAAAAVCEVLGVFVKHLAGGRLPADDPWRGTFERCAESLQHAISSMPPDELVGAPASAH